MKNALSKIIWCHVFYLRTRHEFLKTLEINLCSKLKKQLLKQWTLPWQQNVFLVILRQIKANFISLSSFGDNTFFWCFVPDSSDVFCEKGCAVSHPTKVIETVFHSKECSHPRNNIGCWNHFFVNQADCFRSREKVLLTSGNCSFSFFFNLKSLHCSGIWALAIFLSIFLFLIYVLCSYPGLFLLDLCLRSFSYVFVFVPCFSSTS